MKSSFFLLIILLLTIASIVVADTPPENTIPIVGLKPDYEGIDTDFFCLLSWHHFDGLSRQGHNPDSILANVVLPADTVGMLTVVNPWNLTCITAWYSHMFAMNTDSAYARPGWDGYVIDETHTCTSDTLLQKRTPLQMKSMMEDVAAELETCFNDSSHSVWFYYGYDEAPAWQWNHMMNDTAALHYDNYMPNLFTLAMDSVYRPELDLSADSLWQPTFTRVDSLAVLSWMAWHIHSEDTTREMSMITSCLHTIAKGDWADFTNVPDDPYPGTPAVQANSIRAIFSTKYQEYSTIYPWPAAVDNYPSFIALDAYPFRLVGTAYQDTASYTPSLGSSLENWMINHYEECMDSTFIPAWQIRNDEDKDISVFFVPQAFGRAGGTAMWNTTNVALDYGSYAYRIPTPQEFRMHCNSALLRGAKALLPYCLTSYAGGGGNSTDAGLLDENNIPFDAPYEEWVYTERPKDNLSYISPDSIPPFMNGYYPLYTLPARPIPGQGSQRNIENFLLWKFGPYGRLWNSVRTTFGEIARVAPELALLDWWEDHEDLAEIDYDGTQPTPFLGAQIKIFTDENEDNCYLYYLNRYCRANENPYEIAVDASDFPDSIPFSEYALDHSRRFLIEGDMISRDVYQFLDTLDAGEARLLQMFDSTEGLDADIRITDPDVFVILPVDSDTLSDYEGYPGEQVNIHARFYNMGTEAPQGDVLVYLKDETDNLMLDTARVSFSGLSTDSCYREDRDEAVFEWRPDSTDIGVHRLLVYTESLNEPDTADNDARLVYVVEPRDYATEVMDDPWDMTEAESSPPLWKTDDISAIGGEWIAAGFTDSISGMFEGELSTAISGSILRGDISLAIDGGEPIDTDIYKNLSFAAVCMNPNPNATAAAGAVAHLWWIDTHGDTTSVNISNESEIGAIWNGDTLWREYGPLDLSTVSRSGWSGEEAVEFWLSFRTGKPSAPAIPQPVDIRIGWVKLTE